MGWLLEKSSCELCRDERSHVCWEKAKSCTLHARSNHIHSTTSKRGTRQSNVLTRPVPINIFSPINSKVFILRFSLLAGKVSGPDKQSEMRSLETNWHGGNWSSLAGLLVEEFAALVSI